MTSFQLFVQNLQTDIFFDIYSSKIIGRPTHALIFDSLYRPGNVLDRTVVPMAILQVLVT